MKIAFRRDCYVLRQMLALFSNGMIVVDRDAISPVPGLLNTQR